MRVLPVATGILVGQKTGANKSHADFSQTLSPPYLFTISLRDNTSLKIFLSAILTQIHLHLREASLELWTTRKYGSKKVRLLEKDPCGR